jgi:uncharacterized membrane protein YbaN (DUF454 family)
MLKVLYIILGSFSIFLGILGIIIPGLPTTPFMLLGAWFYLRSSEKLYNKLIKNKFLGKYIRKYYDNKAISLKTKIYSIVLMWIMISISVIFFIKILSVKIIVLLIGLIGTLVMGFVIKTLKK